MADENKKEFSLEDILEEQREVRDMTSGAEDRSAKETEAPLQEQEVSEDTADLNAFATGNISIPGYGSGEKRAAREQPEGNPSGDLNGKKKKKKKGGLFGRKKRSPDFDEEEDMYYGIQLKPIDEYRKGFDPATGEFTVEGDSFKALFDDSKKAIDDEVEANFQKLQKERRRRVAQAVQTAGMDEEQIADEFGIVAPMPVTAFAADPYAKQHGIEVEGGESDGQMSEIQRAMLETSTDKTMEIKLNVLNDTIELQRVKDMPAVSEESVHKILDSANSENSDNAGPSPQERDEAQEAPLQQAEEAVEEILPEEQAASPEKEAPLEELSEGKEENPKEAQSEQTKVISHRPLGEIPQVASIYEYRSRGIPTHVINVDVLQSALLTESEGLLEASRREEERQAPRRRVQNQKLEEQQEEPLPEAVPQEDIDDYTGPEDAKSISRELRGNMHELTLRMLITGVCTVILTIVNMIFGGTFAATPIGELGSAPIVYLILTLVFFGVSAGVCYRTIGNGLKALLSFNANSDSALAVAAAAVLVQTVSALFFTGDLGEGKVHLYAVVLCALLFINAAGKQTMIRRIHSNFRFVASREQKYSVRTYDDYNTALKMAKDCVAEKPLIAYQCKTGFLKRFLELSYNPDPAETASQFLAPFGLIASLVLCIVCLLVTRSVSTALSAFAAAACTCVAAGNMLAVNLPVSRLCKTARRAGAMVAGFEGITELGNVNAVLVDAEELFPLGTVVLNGIKTFGNRAGAEEAIIASSAMMKEVKGPLAGVFEQVISENEESLPQVESISFEDENGITGRVDGKRIYIGNRGLLVNHRIEPPPREEENQYASGNKQVVYLAVDDRVCAMLILTYTADRRKKNELQRLEDNGISVVVRTTDVNVTRQLISRLFGIDTASVGILDSQLGELSRGLMEEEIPRADAKVATKGRVESLMSVICACVGELRSAGLIVALQNAAVILGFVLVAFLACFGGMKQLTSFVLFVFELFWLLVILLIPKLRKR